MRGSKAAFSKNYVKFSYILDIFLLFETVTESGFSSEYEKSQRNLEQNILCEVVFDFFQNLYLDPCSEFGFRSWIQELRRILPRSLYIAIFSLSSYYSFHQLTKKFFSWNKCWMQRIDLKAECSKLILKLSVANWYWRWVQQIDLEAECSKLILKLSAANLSCEICLGWTTITRSSLRVPSVVYFARLNAKPRGNSCCTDLFPPSPKVHCFGSVCLWTIPDPDPDSSILKQKV